MYFYLQLGIRCGFLPAICRFPHLCIYKVVEMYVWFFPSTTLVFHTVRISLKAYNFRSSDWKKSIIILTFPRLHSSAD